MVIIRKIREEDAPAFRQVLDSVCREWKYLARLEAPSLEQARAFVSSNVKNGNPQFVAEVEDKIVGWCDVLRGDASSIAPHVGRLGMGVLKECRRQKIGRRLIEATIEAGISTGLEEIELTVHASNGPAIALYRSIGFEDEGRKKRACLVDGVYDDIILMAFELRQPNQLPADAAGRFGQIP